jgi:DNA-binding response OmpR family regulator
MDKLYAASAHLLLVEDDFDLAANIIDYLQTINIQVSHAPNGGLALNALIEDSFDLILLDINLPGLDGLSLCSKIRKENGLQTPILMLTAADSLEDRLRGFEVGTDDYLIKPFSLSEMEVRINALLRRAGTWTNTSDQIRFGSLRLYPETMQVISDGKQLQLTTMGFRILMILAKAAPAIVQRKDLEWNLWQNEPPGSDSLRAHIFSIRRELEEKAQDITLKTIRNVGHQLLHT